MDCMARAASGTEAGPNGWTLGGRKQVKTSTLLGLYTIDSQGVNYGVGIVLKSLEYRNQSQ